MNKFFALFCLIFPFFFFACSGGSSDVASSRPPEFFDRFVNPAASLSSAKENLSQLRLLEVGEEYPMRFALFADGRFYYQIDRLGDGAGWWGYHDGKIEMTATRPIFDMELKVSAASGEGDNTVVRFIDRHGFNSLPIRLRAPEAALGSEILSEPLREFTFSTKNI